MLHLSIAHPFSSPPSRCIQFIKWLQQFNQTSSIFFLHDLESDFRAFQLRAEAFPRSKLQLTQLNYSPKVSAEIWAEEKSWGNIFLLSVFQSLKAFFFTLGKIIRKDFSRGISKTNLWNKMSAVVASITSRQV